MAYLLLSIVSSTLILVIFKWFGRFGVNNLFAIVCNYLMAATMGYLLSASSLTLTDITHKTWFWPSAALGFLFIALFQLMALGAQRIGLSRVSIAVKMSVALPVLAGVYLYNEQIALAGWAGIGLAMLALVFGTYKKAEGMHTEITVGIMLLPFILFVGNGTIDVMLKYAQVHWLEPAEMATFSGALFGFALFWGVLLSAYTILFKHKRPTLKDVAWGLFLGVPNFGSIYFLLLALQQSGLPSAAVYPINNVAIVMLSTITGMVLFGDKLTRLNKAGIAAALAAIILMAYA